MNSLRRHLFPILIVICFDFIAIVAVMLQVYLTYGCIPALDEVLLSRPICFFWILWSFLIYFCVNGIQNEYKALIINATYQFHSIPKQKIKSIVKEEMLYSYSRKFLVLFGGLPLVCFSSNNNVWDQVSLKKFFILLIPFVLDLCLYCYLTIKRRRFFER